MNENSFFSVDRLVEFGMGMAMAQQMLQIMNQSMKQMYIPGSMQSMPSPQLKPFFVVIEGQSVGPLTESDFSRLVAEKKITKDSLAWMPGMLGWTSIEQIPIIFNTIALTPPPIPSNEKL